MDKVGYDEGMYLVPYTLYLEEISLGPLSAQSGSCRRPHLDVIRPYKVGLGPLTDSSQRRRASLASS